MLKKWRFSAFQWYQLMRYMGLFLCAMMLPHKGFDPTSIARFESLLYYTGLFSFFWIGGVMNRYIKFDPSETLAIHTGKFASANLLFTGIAAFSFCILHYLHPIQDFYLIILYFLLNTPLFITEHYLLLKKEDSTLVAYGLITGFIPIMAALFSNTIDDLFTYLLLLSAIKGVLVHLYFQTISPWWKQFSIQTIFQHSGRILLESAPFAGAILATGAADYIDGFLVKHHFSDASFSIYRYGAREIPYVLILANALSISILPIFQESDQNGMNLLKSKSNLLLHISFPVALVCMLFSDQLFEYFFTTAFIDSSFIFQTYLLLLIPRLMFPQTIMQAKEESMTIFAIAILELLTNVGMSLVLMQSFGLVGIALGTFVAFCFDKLALGLVLRYKYGISPTQYSSFILWAIYSIILTAIYLVKHQDFFF